MTIEVQCPLCMKQFQMKDAAAGKKFRCTSCREVIDIPKKSKPAPRRKVEVDDLEFVDDDDPFEDEFEADSVDRHRRSRQSSRAANSNGLLIGAAIGGGVGLLLIVLLAVAFRQRDPAPPAPPAMPVAQGQPIAASNNSSPVPGNVPTSVPAPSTPVNPFGSTPPLPGGIQAPEGYTPFPFPNPSQMIPKSARKNVPPGTRLVTFNNVRFTGNGDVTALAKSALAGVSWVDASSVQHHPETQQLTCFAVGNSINTGAASGALRQVGIETQGVSIVSR